MAGEANMPAAGRRILLVEDEILICLLIETILSDAGYQVVVVNTIEEAMDAIARGPFAAAILDLNLKGRKVYPVAEKLAVVDTPFIFATGGGGRDIEGFPGRPWVGKPFQESELLAAVNKLVGVGG
jgi:DNA-binding response OmpR family regulator